MQSLTLLIGSSPLLAFKIACQSFGSLLCRSRAVCINGIQHKSAHLLCDCMQAPQTIFGEATQIGWCTRAHRRHQKFQAGAPTGALKVLLEIGQKPVPAPGKRFILRRKATHQGLISYYRVYETLQNFPLVFNSMKIMKTYKNFETLFCE